MSTLQPGPDGVPQDHAPKAAQSVAQQSVAQQSLDGEHWQAVHWATPLIKSWQIVVFGGAAIAHNVGGRWIFESDGPIRAHVPGLRVWLIALASLVMALLVVGVLSYVSWRMTRFRLTPESVELRSGVIFRQHRVAQLDRLQAVDVVQPFLARIFGLSRLNIEVAGGAGSGIALSFLREDDAQLLRNRILAGSAGVAYAPGEVPEAPEHDWIEVPTQRLIGSIVLSSSTFALALMGIGTIGVAVVQDSLTFLIGTAPALLGAIGSGWGRFSSEFGFRVAVSPDGLRLRHGLTETRKQSVPPGRIQAIQVRQPLLWRSRGWWRLEVNVAGYTGQGGDSGTESVLLPVAGRSDVMAVLAYILPDLGVEPTQDPVRLIDAALVGSGPSEGFVTSPRRARWVDWASWRRNGFRVTSQVLVIRSGWLHRSVKLVPHARIQSMGLIQGPVERKLRLVSFALHSTPGPVHPLVPHLDLAVAADLLRTQTENARAARALAGPERWMQRSAPQPTGPVPSPGSSTHAGMYAAPQLSPPPLPGSGLLQQPPEAPQA